MKAKIIISTVVDKEPSDIQALKDLPAAELAQALIEEEAELSATFEEVE